MMTARKLPPRAPVTKRFVSPASVAAVPDESARDQVPATTWPPRHAVETPELPPEIASALPDDMPPPDSDEWWGIVFDTADRLRDEKLAAEADTLTDAPTRQEALDETSVTAPDAATVTVTAAPEGGGVITVEDRAALLQRIPPWVRGALYVLVAVGSVLIAYAVTKRVIGADEVVLWLGITSALGIVAAGNLRI